MKSTATAVWEGGLKDGKGTITAEKGAFKATPYSAAQRFEGAGGPGTTPEELIAAAHAACFSMASSGALAAAGMTPKRLEVSATVTLEPKDGKPTVTSSHLVMKAQVPGADNAKFQEAVNGAKANCPISRLLNTEITLEATLES